MAEKIVQEEERIEKEIAKPRRRKKHVKQRFVKSKALEMGACVLIIPFIYFMIKENGIVKQLIFR